MTESVSYITILAKYVKFYPTMYKNKLGLSWGKLSTAWVELSLLLMDWGTEKTHWLF